MLALNGDVTLADIEDFFTTVGGFFKKEAVDFWNNTSRYQFAYWAGIFVFEIIINVLLALATAGAGNVLRAGSYAEKFAAFSKLWIKEAFSVATLGVVDLLAFFKSIITAFVKACSKGLKGLIRWVKALIEGIKNGKAKNGEELLADAGKAIFRRIVYSGGKRGEALLTLVEKEDILKYAKSYGIKEESIFFKDNISDFETSYSLAFGGDLLYVNTDVMPGVLKTANSRLSWKGAIAHELEGHRAAALVDKTFFDADLTEDANNLLEEIQASVRASAHGKDLSNIERQDLLEDAIERFERHKNYLKETKYKDYTFEQIIKILWTLKN